MPTTIKSANLITYDERTVITQEIIALTAVLTAHEAGAYHPDSDELCSIYDALSRRTEMIARLYGDWIEPEGDDA